MKDFLQKLIKDREERAKELREKIKNSNDANEVRAFGETLQKVLDELTDAKKQLDEMDKNKDDGNGDNGDGNGQQPKQQEPRSFDPIATYGNVQNRSVNKNEKNVEYRTAFMNYVMRNKPIPAELRRNENTLTSDVATVIPTELVNRIIEKMDECGMILQLVTRTSYAAGVVIPTSSVKPVATWVAEGAGSDRQKKTTGKITFSYFKLRCEISMSMEVGTLALSEFETTFVDNVAKAMVIAIEKAILAGNGTSQPKGILTETVPNGQTITIKSADAPTYKELVSAEAAIPVQYESSAKWFMTKKQFMNFVGMTDSAGQPIARVNYGIGGKPERTLLGREVVIHPYATEMGSFVAGIFNFSDYILNTIYDMGITKKQDWETEDLLTKAVMSVDGKAVDNGSLVVLTVAG